MAQDDPTEIVDSISLPEKDPFPGKGYLKTLVKRNCCFQFLLFQVDI